VVSDVSCFDPLSRYYNYCIYHKIGLNHVRNELKTYIYDLLTLASMFSDGCNILRGTTIRDVYLSLSLSLSLSLFLSLSLSLSLSFSLYASTGFEMSLMQWNNRSHTTYCITFHKNEYRLRIICCLCPEALACDYQIEQKKCLVISFILNS
jgi:hypothetical protein